MSSPGETPHASRSTSLLHCPEARFPIWAFSLMGFMSSGRKANPIPIYTVSRVLAARSLLLSTCLLALRTICELTLSPAAYFTRFWIGRPVFVHQDTPQIPSLGYPLSHHAVCDDTTEHLTLSLLPLEISKLLRTYTHLPAAPLTCCSQSASSCTSAPRCCQLVRKSLLCPGLQAHESTPNQHIGPSAPHC